MTEKPYTKVTIGSADELAAREDILKLFRNSPIPDEDILVNLGAYIRSPVLAKILYLNELYQLIQPVPGIIVEFGVWWGANLTLLESFRSVYEPYNRTRKVVGFDTFEGYPSPGEKDGDSPYAAVGGYAVSEGYEAYLEELLAAHEAENVLPHIKKHELVKGDVVETIDRYLASHPETIIALAYFDLALYEPTRGDPAVSRARKRSGAGRAQFGRFSRRDLGRQRGLGTRPLQDCPIAVPPRSIDHRHRVATSRKSS